MLLMHLLNTLIILFKVLKINEEELKSINKSYKLIVEIETSKRKISIKDNAAGIGDDRFKDAFKAAKIPKKIKNKKLLNEFGMGMKSASYWFTHTWRLLTKSIYENETKLVSLNLDDIVEEDNPIRDIKRAYNKSKKRIYSYILRQRFETNKSYTYKKLYESYSRYS